jgi:hypothetical protein
MYHGDLNSRLSCALLAAELLPAVFAGDITHPQRRLDFAAYVPVQIWPGVDVFDDPYRLAWPSFLALHLHVHTCNNVLCSLTQV